MSDEQRPPEHEAETDSEEVEWEDFDANVQDALLTSLVEIANRSEEFAMWVTLSVNGMLISGELIGYRTYFQGLADVEFAEFGEEVQDAWRTHVEAPLPPLEKSPKYIHLRNARAFTPGAPAIPGNRGVHWRGRLSSVSGFSFGFLSAEEG